MNNTNKCKNFLEMLKTNYNNMRYTIDLFVSEHGYHEFLKVKNTLKGFQDYAEIYVALEKEVWFEAEHLSRAKTKQGIFHILGVKVDGDFIDLPIVYIETFPSDTKFLLVV